MYTKYYINGKLPYECGSDDSCPAFEPGHSIPWSSDPQEVRKTCLEQLAKDKNEAEALGMIVERKTHGYEDLQNK